MAQPPRLPGQPLRLSTRLSLWRVPPLALAKRRPEQEGTGRSPPGCGALGLPLGWFRGAAARGNPPALHPCATEPAWPGPFGRGRSVQPLWRCPKSPPGPGKGREPGRGAGGIGPPAPALPLTCPPLSGCPQVPCNSSVPVGGCGFLSFSSWPPWIIPFLSLSPVSVPFTL